MTKRREDDEGAGGAYASPPCFMHELDPSYTGIVPAADAEQRRDVARWRKAERERLLALRLALTPEQRRAAADRIAAHLDALLGESAGLTLAGYWPIKGEPDLRPWFARLRARGVRCALPVVEQPKAPLAFRAWDEGTRLVPGIWNIPVPAEAAAVVPDIVIAPAVGFDRGCYRLGNGGGYYDRTLALPSAKPMRAIGVAYANAEIATVFPQPHDIRLDAIVTEGETILCAAAGGAAP
ncbi:MAG: 5-formyltetrahydrofolate cyclo-ligase [Rhodospirillaceae bacterium]|nr:5-formyltetrahydrofolate cyclo-ligase [Rhodospirillaceae bacterium]